jgi:hypothetical protein
VTAQLRRLLPAVLAAAALAAPASAGAATFTVNTTADGPGDCVTPGGTCTPRQAELTANNEMQFPGLDQVNLPAGTYDSPPQAAGTSSSPSTDN